MNFSSLVCAPDSDLAAGRLGYWNAIRKDLLIFVGYGRSAARPELTKVFWLLFFKKVTPYTNDHK